MNVRFWIAAFMMISLSVAEAEAANTAPPAIRISPRSPALPPSKSWFREKYLVGFYAIDYDYNLNRFEFGDNDRDMCPDVYKLATLFAITGRYFLEMKHTCASLYVQLPTNNNDSHIVYNIDYNIDYILPRSFELQDLEMIYIIATDVLQFLGQLLCYIFDIGITILSVIFASCFTLFMVILMFCQYW